jgi:hypothetical protein
VLSRSTGASTFLQAFTGFTTPTHQPFTSDFAQAVSEPLATVKIRTNSP